MLGLLDQQLLREICDLRGGFRIGGLALAGFTRWLACGSFDAKRNACPLLFAYLFKCQAGAECDYIQDRMCCVTGHAQRMDFFPYADTNCGSIGGRALLGECTLPLMQRLPRVQSQ